MRCLLLLFARAPEPESLADGPQVLAEGRNSTAPAVPFANVEPFGRENKAQMLTEGSIKAGGLRLKR